MWRPTVCAGRALHAPKPSVALELARDRLVPESTTAFLQCCEGWRAWAAKVRCSRDADAERAVALGQRPSQWCPMRRGRFRRCAPRRSRVAQRMVEPRAASASGTARRAIAYPFALCCCLHHKSRPAVVSLAAHKNPHGRTSLSPRSPTVWRSASTRGCGKAGCWGHLSDRFFNQAEVVLHHPWLHHPPGVAVRHPPFLVAFRRPARHGARLDCCRRKLAACFVTRIATHSMQTQGRLN